MSPEQARALALARARVRIGQGGPAPGQPPEAIAAPQWSDLPGNIPGSAMKFGGDVAGMFMDPAGAMEGIGNLLKGGVQKLLPPKGQKYEAYVDRLGDFVASRYGSLEAAKETAITDPIGSLADVSMLMSGGGTAAARLPGKLGQLGQAVQTAGRVSDPLSIAGSVAKAGVTKVLEPVASNIMGSMAGTGAAPIRQAAEAGAEGGRAAKTFLDNLRGKAATDDVVVQAKLALGKMRAAKSEEYVAGMKKISKDKTVLDFGPIDDAVAGVAEIGVYKGQTIRPSTTVAMDEIRKAVDDWKKLDPAEFHTPEGLDALKQKIGDIASTYDYNTQPRVVADQIYNAIKEQIVKQAPDYARVMEDYTRATDLVREIERSLSLGKKTAADTALRKLTSVMRNNVNTNYGARQRSMNVLEDALGAPLMPAVAGQAMSSAMPRGLAGSTPQLAATGIAGSLLTPWALATVPFQSPRLIGEAAYYGGKALNPAIEAAQRIGPTRARAAGRGLLLGGRLQDY